MDQPNQVAAAGRRRRPWLRIVLAQFLLLAAGLGVLEVVHRLATSTGREHTSSGARDLLTRTRASIHSDLPVMPGEQEKAKPRKGDPVLHPFTGYDKVLALDLVNEEVERKARGEWDEAYEIMIIGGSVSKLLCDEVGDQIAELVSADPRFAGRNVRMICLGSGGFKQPQQVTLAAWLFSLDLIPDALINIDGFNEVALSTSNAQGFNVHPLYPSFTHWGKIIEGTTLTPDNVRVASRMMAGRDAIGRYCDWALRLWFHHSSAATAVARAGIDWELSKVHRLQRILKHQITSSQSKQLSGPPIVTRELTPADLSSIVAPNEPDITPLKVEFTAKIMGVIVAGWMQSSRSLRGMCSTHGVQYLHVLQPTLHDPGSKTVTNEEARGGRAGQATMTGVASGYPRLRTAGVELAREGLAFHDSSLLYVDRDDTLYVDTCHVNQLGNQLLAADVAAAFLASLP